MVVEGAFRDGQRVGEFARTGGAVAVCGEQLRGKVGGSIRRAHGGGGEGSRVERTSALRLPTGRPVDGVARTVYNPTVHESRCARVRAPPADLADAIERETR